MVGDHTAVSNGRDKCACHGLNVCRMQRGCKGDSECAEEVEFADGWSSAMAPTRSHRREARARRITSGSVILPERRGCMDGSEARSIQSCGWRRTPQSPCVSRRAWSIHERRRNAWDCIRPGPNTLAGLSVQNLHTHTRRHKSWASHTLTKRVPRLFTPGGPISFMATRAGGQVTRNGAVSWCTAITITIDPQRCAPF